VNCLLFLLNESLSNFRSKCLCLNPGGYDKARYNNDPIWVRRASALLFFFNLRDKRFYSEQLYILPILHMLFKKGYPATLRGDALVRDEFISVEFHLVRLRCILKLLIIYYAIRLVLLRSWVLRRLNAQNNRASNSIWTQLKHSMQSKTYVLSVRFYMKFTVSLSWVDKSDLKKLIITDIASKKYKNTYQLNFYFIIF